MSKPVLERAFLKTYGLELGQVILNVDLSVGSFRFAVRNLIPIASRAAWQSKKSEIRKEIPQARRREYVYKDSEQEYEQKYGSDYEHPGIGARIVSYFIRILPKIGPLKPFAFKLPDPRGPGSVQGQLPPGDEGLLLAAASSSPATPWPSPAHAGQRRFRYRPPYPNSANMPSPTRPTVSGCASCPTRSSRT